MRQNMTAMAISECLGGIIGYPPETLQSQKCPYATIQSAFQFIRCIASLNRPHITGCWRSFVAAATFSDTKRS